MRGLSAFGFACVCVRRVPLAFFDRNETPPSGPPLAAAEDPREGKEGEEMREAGQQKH